MDRRRPSKTLLDIRNLSVRFAMPIGQIDAVQDVSLHIDPGERVALVGESGSGKSVTAASILGLLPYPRASHPSGSIGFEGKQLLGAGEEILRRIRGDRIGMIFQEPMVSLNPLHTIEKQICETLILHKKLKEHDARQRALQLLQRVRIRDPERQLGSWPHQLSGGQRQRVMIAMALANEPRLLIADEPTTAVDVTTQAQILALLNEICRNLDMALLLITHDLGVVRKTADRVYVMQGGRIVESGATNQIFEAPEEAYTRTLIEAEPKARRTVTQKSGRPLLEVDQLGVWFGVRRGILQRTTDHVKAVDGVNLTLHPGRTMGVVGESGSGKTTLALALLRLTKSRGAISFKGQRIDGLRRNILKDLRRQMQIVFQDPYGSLSPRMSVGDIIAEGLAAHGISEGKKQESEVIDTLEEVGLEPDVRLRYPHEFSGGQRQRIALARALILKPALIVLDEPTSALDRAVQSQMIDLLLRLQETHGLSYIFISHDLRVVRALADEIIVMRSGRIVEHGAAEKVFTAPKNDYTRSLIKAAMDFEVWNDTVLSQ
tara:strand:- start:2198 stop:3838 length:1641 start_codon:yes stop_codon:yes gene_type:complete